MSFWAIGLLVANLALVAAVVALPLGLRGTRQVRVIKAPADRIWQALFPLGKDVGFDGDIVGVRPVSDDAVWLSYSWRNREDSPIERLTKLEDVRPGEHFAMHVAEDSSLDLSFWKHFRETVTLRPAASGATEVEITQVDSYRGAAFLIFRYFALRRKMARLSAWAETGAVPTGGLVFEHPLSQVGFAGLSALLIWPLFGLNWGGFAAAVALTTVIAVHELGHVAAFRIVGHRTARMIFLPLLGGIAIGGRPYDKKFEVAFVALMGPGFSAFLVAAFMLAAYESAGGWSLAAVTIGGLVALFNLANLLPVWRFDGAQVLRQITGHWQTRVLAELLLLSPFVLVALWLGASMQVVASFSAVIIGLAVLTRNAVFKPKKPLTPMSSREMVLVGFGLAAVTAIHAVGVVWAADRLVPLFS